MEIKDVINEIKNIHDRLDNIGIEARDLRNKLRTIVKSLSKTQANPEDLSANKDFTASPKDFCPQCNSDLIETGTMWQCSKEDCLFTRDKKPS